MQTTRILLVDDHPMLRRGVAELLNAEPGLSVCGEAGNMSEALTVAVKQSPDLVIVDVSLDGANGIELIKHLATQAPTSRVLAYSMHDEEIFAERALRAGARGYLMKQAPPETLLEAIEQIRDGRIYLSAAMSERLLDRAVSGGSDATASPLEALSDRELEVFQALGNGSSTAQIATQLGLSVKTIETYREHLKRKLGLRSGQELLRYAIEWAVQDGRRQGSDERPVAG